ncbi:unnamed protein product [Rotaria sp. Silwood2]|nr:unnamed protein product [Rotaria sp. Silwood2]CAF2823267.1 unnamed protein product [Rotaria sp. Silwood2]CAF2975650.1 unnamed protein product [Rotaria sp. Silwood2]CAF3945690.1 unnamed protein product [Rotaria sp. Silwood2]CAF4081212.1 unnamed protein product [Rotaria sp. Silwood2]
MYFSVLSKRINGLWGKRLNNLWGKRSDSDSDEMHQYVLQELYDQARRNQFAHPRFSAYNDLSPLTIEKLMAQRIQSNDDNENAADNMS